MLALVEDRLGILHIWLFIVSVKYELVTLLCGKLLLKFTGRCRDLVSDIVLVAAVPDCWTVVGVGTWPLAYLLVTFFS